MFSHKASGRAVDELAVGRAVGRESSSEVSPLLDKQFSSDPHQSLLTMCNVHGAEIYNHHVKTFYIRCHGFKYRILFRRRVKRKSRRLCPLSSTW